MSEKLVNPADSNHLTFVTTFIEQLGGLVTAGCVFLFALLAGGLRKHLVSRARKEIADSWGLTSKTVQMSRTLEHHILRLRESFDASRVSIFQFHNGEIFMLADHSWKVSCTHESVAPGVTHTSRENQNILVSQVVDWVDPIVTGEAVRTQGCELLDLCQKSCGDCTKFKGGQRVFRFTVRDMSPSYARYLAENQGIGVVYAVPLLVPGTKVEPGSVFGFVSVQFRTLMDVDLKAFEANAPIICKLCQTAAEIQFLLHSASDHKKKR